jgi:hypothetical protein
MPAWKVKYETHDGNCITEDIVAYDRQHAISLLWNCFYIYWIKKI